MPKSAKRSGIHCGHSRGFSMVELAVSMCVMLILTAIAIPSLMQSFRAYQLNDAAARISDLLKFTRFEAVRRNTAVTLQIKQAGNDWYVWADSNNNGNVDPAEKQILVTGFATLLAAGGSPGPPSSASITATLGPVTTLTTLSGANNSVSFDARGAVSPLAADVFYIGSTTNPEFGYRAVILLPSGATQIWTAPASGPWQRLS
jgi:prepilin-type N-terminal cleavage/methylation domain-containing protein